MTQLERMEKKLDLLADLVIASSVYVTANAVWLSTTNERSEKSVEEACEHFKHVKEEYNKL